MRRWCFFFESFELPGHFFLALEQCSHLQLQAFNGALLRRQYITQ
jgi:hypothetical protein